MPIPHTAVPLTLLQVTLTHPAVPLTPVLPITAVLQAAASAYIYPTDIATSRTTSRTATGTVEM